MSQSHMVTTVSILNVINLGSLCTASDKSHETVNFQLYAFVHFDDFWLILYTFVFDCGLIFLILSERIPKLSGVAYLFWVQSFLRVKSVLSIERVGRFRVFLIAIMNTETSKPNSDTNNVVIKTKFAVSLMFNSLEKNWTNKTQQNDEST